MRKFPMLLFFFSLVPVVSVHAVVGGRSEAVSGARSAGGSQGNGECSSPFCLPKSVVDDDPTLGAKLPDCGLLGTMMGPGKNQSDSSGKGSSESECSSDRYAKPTDEQKARQARLYKCLEQVRKILPADYQQQKKFISGLRSARLKTYLGMVYTTYGEATPEMKVEDHLAIAKVLDNRTRTCVNGSEPEATTWDIATSPNQFSMYNANIYGAKGKETHIKNKEKDEARMKLAIEAFTKLQCAKLEPRESWEKAEHYKANYVKPKWAKGKDLIISGKVNGDPIASKEPYHQFYQLAWQCSINKAKSSKAVAFDSRTSRLEWLGLLSSTAHATEASAWEMVDYEKRGFYLRLKNRTLTQIKVHSDPLGARILAVKPHKLHKFIDVIEYDAGEFGTSEIVNVHRAVLFDTRSGKILGDYPLRYRVAGAKVQPTQPKWTDSSSGISIYDPETGDTETLDF